MHLPLTGDAGLAGEGVAFDHHIEMALSAFAMTGVPLVAIAVVNHLKTGRRERRSELFTYRF